MSKTKKSYDALSKEIQKLLDEQEAIKDQKLNKLLNEFEKEFRKKYFQEKVVSCEDSVLKAVAKSMIADFDKYVEKTKSETNASAKMAAPSATAEQSISTEQVSQASCAINPNRALQ